MNWFDQWGGALQFILYAVFFVLLGAVILYAILRKWAKEIRAAFDKALQEKEKEHLSNMAYSDYLTRLYNRHYLGYWKEYLLPRSSFPISVITADCNDLKLMNDRLGHEYGDILLRTVSDLLRNQFPGEEYAILRMGGDEFLVLGIGVSEAVAREKIRLFEQEASKLFIEGVPVSMCFGSYTANEQPFDLNEAIGFADTEMMRNKQRYHEQKARREAERSQKDREEWKKLVNDSSRMIYVRDDADQKILFMNRAIRRWSGREETELPADIPYGELICGGRAEKDDGFDPEKKAIADGQPIEYYQESTGRYFQLEYREMDWEDRRAHVFYITDITETSINNLITGYLTREGYDGLGILNLDRDSISIRNFSLGKSKELKPSVPIHYSGWVSLAEEYLVAPDERKKFTSFANLENLRKRVPLKTPYTCILHCFSRDGGQCLVKFGYHQLRGDGRLILLTLENCTEDFERDSVTQLYTRSAFSYYTSQILQGSGEREKFAVCFFDICDFKAFNEKYGAISGNVFLRQVAKKLEESFLKPRIVARTQASDHFLCLVDEENLDLPRIPALCQEEFRADGKARVVYLRCGICRVKDKRAKVSGLCDRAKLAADQIRGGVYLPYNIFNEKMNDVYMAQTDMMGHLNNALENGELCVYYQPIYETATGKIASAEALIRWKNPSRGVLSPSLFIPMLEQNGHILQLDNFVAESVRDFVEKRKKKGKTVVPVSVNLSRISFMSESGIESMLETMRQHSEESPRPRIEVTETAYAAMLDSRKNILGAMQEMGASILLDDFGSGYSSFSAMAEYDFDVVKLDMGFVQKIGRNNKAENIIRAVITMTHDIGARVVAEGVETEEQMEFLAACGCDFIQGFYFSEPLEQEKFEELLDRL